MPKILNPEVLQGWSLDDIKDLEECINYQLRGYPKGIYYFLLCQHVRPNVSLETFFEEMEKCKTYEELMTLYERLMEKYGAKKTDIYSLFFVGTKELKDVHENCIVLKVRKYR